jgi:hypothetical protein
MERRFRHRDRLHRGHLTPKCQAIVEQRLDETEVGEGTAVTLITMKRPAEWTETTNPADCAQAMAQLVCSSGIASMSC